MSQLEGKKKSDRLQRIFAFTLMAGMAVLAFWVTQNNDAIAGALYKSFAGGGTAPTPKTLETAGATGFGPFSIAQAADGFPMLTYPDYNGVFTFKFVKCADVACSSPTINSPDLIYSGDSSSVVLRGSDGLPVAFYQGIPGARAMFLKCNNSLCTSTTTTALETVGSAGWYGGMTIGSDGLPVMVFDSQTDGHNSFVKCNNLTCSSNTNRRIDHSLDWDTNNLITIEGDRLPAIVVENTNLYFIKCNDISCASSTTPLILDTPTSGGSSITTDPSGLLIASYYDNTNSRLKFLRCNDLLCTSTTTSILDASGDNDVYPAIALGMDKQPVITYHDATTHALKLVKCRDQACSAFTTVTLDSYSAASKQFTAVAIGSDGFPMIGYYDKSSLNAKFLHCNGACGAVTHVQHSQNVIPGSTLQNGLVGLWSFNGPDMSWTQNKAFDRSGNGNDGTLVNMATRTSPTIGKIGQALSFDGVNDYVDMGNQAAFNFDVSTSHTVSLWLKWIGPGHALDAIFEKHTSPGSPNTVGTGYELATHSTAPGGIRFYFRDGTNGSICDGPAGMNVRDGAWHHIVLSVNRGTAIAKIYIDTIASAGCDFSTIGDLSNAVSFNLGSAGGASTIAVTGLIDEVRLYNRALSQAEITQLYQSGAATINASQNNKNTSGLVGEWSFNGPDMSWTQNKALDRSGNGNDGTLLNMATRTSPTIGKIGQALKFDGVNDYMDAGDQAAFDFDMSTNHSISLWAKFLTAKNTDLILEKHTDPGSPVTAGTGYELAFSASASGHLRFYERDGTNGLNLDGPASVDARDGNWHHIVITEDRGANVVIIYVDTAISGGDISAIGDMSNAVSLDFGSAAGVGSLAGNEALDEVRIYNRVLSRAEIQNLYLQGR